MAKILFIDDRMIEVERQWKLSGCEDEHELLPTELFKSIERTLWLVKTFKPEIILIGHGLGKIGITGSNVIPAIREAGYNGKIIANSGGGKKLFENDGIEIDASADRKPCKLKTILNELMGGKNGHK